MDDLLSMLKAALDKDEWFQAYHIECTLHDVLPSVEAKLYVPESQQTVVLPKKMTQKQRDNLAS